MRFVFRRSGSLIGVYVGRVLAYGAIGLLASGIPADSIRYTLIGLVTASALLHFYYDGFIWKVRETQTRTALGLDGAGISANAPPRRCPVWTSHSLRWAALIIPFGVLCASQLLGRVVPPLERFAKVAEVLPQDAKAQLNYGKALHEAGRVEEAILRYELALARDSSLAEAEFLSGLAWSDVEEWDRAVTHYERALSLEPKTAKTEANLAGVLLKQRKFPEARRHYECALNLNPELDLRTRTLRTCFPMPGEYDAAIKHYLEVLRINPGFRAAKDNLSFARSLSGNR